VRAFSWTELFIHSGLKTPQKPCTETWYTNPCGGAKIGVVGSSSSSIINIEKISPFLIN